MNSDSRVYLAGHRGMVGSALARILARRGYKNVVTASHEELELRDPSAVARFLAKAKPEVVLLAAARVGGIQANDTRPAEFIHDNVAIEANLIHEAAKAGVQSLLLFGSSCMYPRDARQPIHESALMTGPLEPTNRPYAVAKIVGAELCWAYNRQYATHYLCAVPTGIYGPGDNYDLQASHVLPALIRRFHEAKEQGHPAVTLWGTGAPLREFLHCDDLAAACIHLMELPRGQSTSLFGKDEPPLVNVGGGEEVSIHDLAYRVRDTVGADVAINWDATKPDGAPRKLLDSRRLANVGWSPAMKLETGLRQAYADFLAQRARH